MYVLKQYYSEAGQIMSAIPDMATREFYRDICVHTFNEMFVPTSAISGPTFTTVPGSVFYNFGGGSGDPLTVIADYFPVSIVDGASGRKACVTSASTHVDKSIVEGDKSKVFGLSGDVTCKSIFKSPASEIETNWGPYFSFQFEYINTTSDAEYYSGETTFNICGIELDFYKTIYESQYANQLKFIQLSCTPSGADWTSVRCAEDASFLSDGNWHLLEIVMNHNGVSTAKIDGATIATFQMDSSIVRFYRPVITAVLWGAGDQENMYTIDSAWIQTI